MAHIEKQDLRQRILNDPDIDIDIGPSNIGDILKIFVTSDVTCSDSKNNIATPPICNKTEIGQHVVLGTLLRQLLRRDNMEVNQLAKELRVSEQELHSIERDKNFTPNPRTISLLANYYKLPPKVLIRLTPASVDRDPSLENAAVRFAACSDGIAKLSRDERKQLNDFIKILSHYKD